MPIVDYTTTTTALLEGLRDPSNEPVWRAFDARFRPVIAGFARRLGLAEADAADATQETLIRFVKEYQAGKYDRSRGRLRDWIIGISKYRIADIQRARWRQRVVAGDSVIADLPGDDKLTEIWDEELERRILDEAMVELKTSTKLKDKTFEAFRLVAIEQVPPAQAASRLDMSSQAVYMAKHHCLDKLRRIVANLNEAYEVL